VLTGLAPLVSSRTRLLILGSFPGVASLQAQQYYGHPQNHFWKILRAIWPSSPITVSEDSYQKRSAWLLDRGLGVWDVYAACEREGSLDSRIRQPVVNDFSQILQQCPRLEAIAHNGGESFKHARHVRAALENVPAAVRRAGPPQASTAPSGGSALHEVKSVGVQFHKLPSTSPANASWSFERKLAAWREVFARHGLV
jgi:hypoxanthine-DNA glycosylase